ncbi:MAG: hypothetical protein QNJ40_23470, partial [Xanthomonadales bacterium]|nr:hypothetical protein [Xanthomonadales bacterium]
MRAPVQGSFLRILAFVALSGPMMAWGGGVPTVNVEVIDGSAAEAGTDAATVRFTRDTTTGSLTIQTTVLPISTADINDYTDNNSSVFRSFRQVTIANGQSAYDLVLTPVEDILVEGEERLDLELAESPDYNIGSEDSATVTIADDPPVVTVTAVDGSAIEGTSDTATFRFERSGGNIAQALTINTTLDGTTTADINDYTDNNSNVFRSFREVTIGSGQTAFDLVITAVADILVEGEETLDLTLAPGSYIIGEPSSAGVVIA